MRQIVLFAGLTLVGFVPAPAHAGGGFVIVDDFSFAPDVSVMPRPGYVISWEWADDVIEVHNVRQDRRLFYSGAPTADPNATFARTFSAGVFHYYCEVHGSPTGPMDAVVRVPPLIATGPPGLPFTVRWSTATSNVGQAFDVQYRVDGGSWVAWRTDTQLFKRVFGKSGNPIPVQSGHTYAFRARTQKGAATPVRVSGWSPAGHIDA